MGTACKARYETRYLYRGELHADFPLFNFWLHTNKAALLNKLMPESPLKHRSVLALAAPTGCDIEDTVPWHRFQL